MKKQEAVAILANAAMDTLYAMRDQAEETASEGEEVDPGFLENMEKIGRALDWYANDFFEED